MTWIVTAQKINNENYDIYLNGWLGDEYYENAYFGGLVFKFGSWVLVQNTTQGTNEEVDYQSSDLDKVLWDIDCEVIDFYPNNQEELDDFLKHQ